MDTDMKTKETPNDWPSNGSIEFVNYSTKYRTDLDYVLRDLSFKIKPKEKVNIYSITII